jgi:hypothetical protein
VVPPGYALAVDYVPTAADYVRPKSASPTKVSLVPAFKACAAPDRTHGPPLAFPSCNPPEPASSWLTIGTPDANGQASSSTGSAKYAVTPGNPGTLADEADVQVNVSITDVRNQAGLTDYTGQLRAAVSVRVTDRMNGPGGNEQATMMNVEMPVTVPCTATPGAGGSNCSVSTTMEAIQPGVAPEGKRSVWEFGQIEVYDGGPDGLASTTGNNTLFAKQGVFVP